MYSDSRKIQLIEEVLKLDDQKVLKEVESILKKATKSKRKHKKLTFDDFFGIWNTTDAKKIEKAIADAREQLNLDDWK